MVEVTSGLVTARVFILSDSAAWTAEGRTGFVQSVDGEFAVIRAASGIEVTLSGSEFEVAEG